MTIGIAERVARAHEARGLHRRVDVEHAGEHARLVADDADGPAVEPSEPAHDVARPVLVDLEELAVVDDPADHRRHVVGLRRRVRDQRVELGVGAVDRIGGRHPRHGIEVVLRQEREQVARVVDQRLLVVGDEVGDAGALRVGVGPAQILEADLLAGHGAHDLGPGDEHVRGEPRHQHEVGHRRRVDGAARARPHDERDLRDHARGLHVAPEDLGVAAQRDDALLDARAAGVVDADERAAEAHGEIHDLADLLGEGLAERPAEDREVLREDAHAPAVHETVARDDAVAVGAPLHHVEVRVAVADVGVQLDERAGVEEGLDALARGALPSFVLSRDGALVAGVPGLVPEPLESRELARGRVRIGLVGQLACAHGARVARAVPRLTP